MTQADTAPELSVIMPCHDGMPWLTEQLDALCAQRDPRAWELVVVDNASSDASAATAARYADRLPVRVVPAPALANVAYARNVGVAAARADKLAFLDADDRVGPHWVRAMAAALDEHDLVAGVNVPDSTTSAPAVAGMVAAATPTEVAPPARFLPYAQGSALGVRRSWYDTVGGFDVGLATVTGEDAAFSWDVQLAGGRYGEAPEAVVRYRTRADVRSAFRQQRTIGTAQPALYVRYRHAGMRRSGPAEVALRWGALVATAPLVPFSARVRGRWLGTLARRWGRVLGSWRARVLYL